MTNNIKRIISENGLKISYVVEKTGLSRSAFYHIMNGDNIPSLLNAITICSVLKKSLDEVFPDVNFDDKT